MATAELTIHLPQDELDFAEEYARRHRMTLSELVDRQLRSLRTTDAKPVHPDVEKMLGLLPDEVDARAAHIEHLERKHR